MTRSTILVPLNGSSAADAALRYAAPIALTTKARIRLLAVSEPPPIAVSGRTVEASLVLDEARRASLRRHLAAAAASLGAQGVERTTSLVSGDPARMIVAEAAEADVQLVVMATHARGGVARWFIGSVADSVMRRSPAPVLLIPPSEAFAEPETASFTRLLVPLDGSELAEAALPLVSGLAGGLGSTLVLARAETFVSGMSPDIAYVPSVPPMEEEVVAEAYAYLRAVRGRLPDGLAVETVVLRGAPGPALTEFAHETAANMVVMTTHGRGGLRRLAMGSVADHLVRSGLPTLLIRPGQRTHALVGGERWTSAGDSASSGAMVTRDRWLLGTEGWVAQEAAPAGQEAPRSASDQTEPRPAEPGTAQRPADFVWLDDLDDSPPPVDAAPGGATQQRRAGIAPAGAAPAQGETLVRR